MDHPVFIRTESTHSGPVERSRRPANGVTLIRWTTGGSADAEVVARLGRGWRAGAGESEVNQTRVLGNWSAHRATSRGAGGPNAAMELE
jgi:hypothetical protein